jgi:CBS domain-containing protein
MLTGPKVLQGSATVAEIRRLFSDEHVHVALLVEAGRLVAAIERRDLLATIDGSLPARLIGHVTGRTVSPEAPLHDVFAAMRGAGLRRLAVVDGNGILLGLLGLKASGLGFCSDSDVERRAADRGTGALARPSAARDAREAALD